MDTTKHTQTDKNRQEQTNSQIDIRQTDRHTHSLSRSGVYHKVPQLQPPLAAVEEGVPLSDDGALRLAELCGLLSKLYLVAHPGFDFHVRWHNCAEHVQDTQVLTGTRTWLVPTITENTTTQEC